MTPKNMESRESFEQLFVFCAVWAFGAALTVSDDGIDYKKMFSDWWALDTAFALACAFTIEPALTLALALALALALTLILTPPGGEASSRTSRSQRATPCSTIGWTPTAPASSSGPSRPTSGSPAPHTTTSTLPAVVRATRNNTHTHTHAVNSPRSHQPARPQCRRAHTDVHSPPPLPARSTTIQAHRCQQLQCPHPTHAPSPSGT